MEKRSCLGCGLSLALRREGAQTCSARCRMRVHRRSRLPAVMTSGRRWVRADGKRPVTVSGTPASSTKPATWASFAEVRASKAGDGFGMMLGGGIGCYDLDHVSDAAAREFIETITEPILYAERSMSGSGVHVFVEATEGPGWKRGNVERYTRARFIRTTLVPFI